MSKRANTWLVMLAGLALSGGACASEDPDTLREPNSDQEANGEASAPEGFFEERDLARALASEDPSFATAESADGTNKDVRLWRLLVPVERRWVGGNIEEQDHYWTVGGPCNDGFVRAETTASEAFRPNPKVVKLSGHGACDFAGWESPDDPTDCRARIHAHTNAFWGNVVCETSLYEMPERRSCCDARNGPSCDDTFNGRNIAQCVCQRDSYCCNTAWDDACVAEVRLFGCANRDFCS